MTASYYADGDGAPSMTAKATTPRPTPRTHRTRETSPPKHRTSSAVPSGLLSSIYIIRCGIRASATPDWAISGLTFGRLLNHGTMKQSSGVATICSTVAYKPRLCIQSPPLPTDTVS
jgi:hypothetical protein